MRSDNPLANRQYKSDQKFFDTESVLYQLRVPPIYSGRLKVGLATIAPVGSYMRSFRARALRCTASFQDPEYFDFRIHEAQYRFVS